MLFSKHQIFYPLSKIVKFYCKHDFQKHTILIRHFMLMFFLLFIIVFKLRFLKLLIL